MSRKHAARRLMPGPERDKLAAVLKARYEAGASIRELAEDTGRSYGRMHRLLTEAGWPCARAAARPGGAAWRFPCRCIEPRCRYVTRDDLTVIWEGSSRAGPDADPRSSLFRRRSA